MIYTRYSVHETVPSYRKKNLAGLYTKENWNATISPYENAPLQASLSPSPHTQSDYKRVSFQGPCFPSSLSGTYEVSPSISGCALGCAWICTLGWFVVGCGTGFDPDGPVAALSL